jgi:hypothetical protein
MLTVSFAIVLILFSGILLPHPNGSRGYGWVARSFLAAYSLMILIGYAVLIAVPQVYGKRLVFCAILVTLICCIVKRRKAAFAFCCSAKDFILPAHSLQCSSCSASSAIDNARYFLVIASSLALIVYGIMAASPVNYDSNTYNVARTMLFVAQGTMLPESVGSLRQVLYEYGHDILYWPDICFYNLRGLGLLSSLEFIVLLGAAQRIVLVVWDGFFLSKAFGGKSGSVPGKAVQFSLIAVVVLILCSSQQVMQGVLTKNDLIIVVLMMISSGCALELNNCLYRNKLKMKPSYLPANLIVPQVLAFGIAYSSKSYGPIVGISLLASLLISMLYASGSAVKLKVRSAFETTDIALLVLSVATAMTSAAALSLSKLRYSYDTIGVSSVTSAWSLHDLTILDRFTALLLNLARVVYQLWLFPVSTLKKGLWVPSVFRSEFATGGGTSYSLIELHTHDSAYPSWIILSLLSFCLAWLAYLVLWRRDMLREYLLAKPVSISVGVLLLISCLATMVLFLNIAYQPWMSRFLGCVYVPLFPIMAYLLGILMASATRYASGPFSGFLCLATVSALVGGNFTGSLNLVDGQMNMSRLLTSFNSNPESSYKVHLANKGVPSVQAESLIQNLRSAKYESLVLCHEENTWNLVPLYEASINASFNGKNLSTQKAGLCPAGDKGILTKSANGITYVVLP